MREQRKWTPEDEANLVVAYEEGPSIEALAQRFGCSKSSIRNKLTRLRKSGRIAMGRNIEIEQGKRPLQKVVPQ